MHRNTPANAYISFTPHLKVQYAENVRILTHTYIHIIRTYTPKCVTHGVYTHINISAARLLGWRSRNELVQICTSISCNFDIWIGVYIWYIYTPIQNPYTHTQYLQLEQLGGTETYINIVNSHTFIKKSQDT